MTKRGYVAGALGGLVLLVVPLGLVPYVLDPVSGGDRSTASPVQQRVAGDPGVAASMSCDDAATPAPSAPTGVVAARLCAIDNRNTSWFGPQDGLHSNLTSLVDLLASLEPLPESTDESPVICTNDGGNAFDLRLALASGEVVSVAGDTGGCSTVTIGGEEVGGSDEVVATFMDALAEQRLTTEPPADLVDLPLQCGQERPDRDHRLSVLGDPNELVRAVTCWRPNAVEVGPWRDQRPVPPRLLAKLVDDLSVRSEAQEGFGEPDCPGGDAGYYWQDLVGQTRWGDVVAVRGVCREFLASPVRSWEYSDGSQSRFWHPSPSAQRILDGLRR
ncbi:hypothetical protein KDN32_15855 [Nocardioides sp. J2M5]|uniref:hypothetical protein n=1 Tax=Nocardioides palaemonis TaxID=2829810 RepID=UPI001BA54A16|nr:hypothetical protein [Nocardioides palaemonis]MBS2939216.1 hypothetical protein [Nocardioides palaemonis]